MKEKCSRRSFLGTSLIGAASLSTLSLGTASASEDGADACQPTDMGDTGTAETAEADIAVVGIGIAGLMACIGAADLGASVIGIDRLESFDSANSAYVSGMWVTGSEIQAGYPLALTEQEAFEHMYEGTNYQQNAKLLRRLVDMGGKAADLLTEYGLLANPYEDLTEDSSLMERGSFFYTLYYGERAQVYMQMLEDRNVELHLGTRATSLILDGGTVAGVRCEKADGSILDVYAKNVILATGGFIQNADMVAKYFGGASILGPGNKYCDGSGIQMAQGVGAQIGKNFSIAANESGGANSKATPSYPLASPGFTFNNLFTFPLFGGLAVDRYGTRFVNEQLLAEQIMFCAEPIIRESEYYIVTDEPFMEKLRTEPCANAFDPTMYEQLVDVVKQMYEGKTWTDLDEDIQEAADQGWLWKADSLEELAETLGMDNLVQTVSDYNSYCDSGVDTELFKEERYLKPVTEGPFYVIQQQISAWMTIGGIKTDENCQALDSQGNRIPHLFIAGSDADLWSVPYYQGGSASGFCNASGLIAAQAAVEQLSQ